MRLPTAVEQKIYAAVDVTIFNERKTYIEERLRTRLWGDLALPGFLSNTHDFNPIHPHVKADIDEAK